MKLEEIMRHYEEGVTERGGCGGPVLVTMFTLLLLFVLSGCKTVSNTESYVEKHQIESLFNKMDSVLSKSQTVVQDSAWHETVIKELQSIRERNDTSHYVVVDTAGKVIKETIVINNTKEVSSERDRQEILFLRHSVEKMDSVLSVQNEQISRMDSLLQQSSKETVIEKRPWWKSLWDQLRGIITGIVLCAVVVMILRIKRRFI